MRVAIARALAPDPRLLLVDEPTLGVDLLARDGILALLRSLAGEGIAVLTSTGESVGLAGADARSRSATASCAAAPAGARGGGAVAPPGGGEGQ